MDTIRLNEDVPPPAPLSGLRGQDGKLSGGDRPRRTLRRRNALVANALNVSGKRVLDLGCAEGLHSLYMADRGATVLGVDHRRSVIRVAEANRDHLGIDGATFQVRDTRDRSFWDACEPFDVVIAWGLLHRVSDIFGLLASVSAVTSVLSLEWRTPIIPLMESASIAYHPAGSNPLDPMNLAFETTLPNLSDDAKIEGPSGFWEPTLGAVKQIMRRLGFSNSCVVGYDEDFARVGRTYLRGARRLLWERQMPMGRVHMIFCKDDNAMDQIITPIQDTEIPKWDEEMAQNIGLPVGE